MSLLPSDLLYFICVYIFYIVSSFPDLVWTLYYLFSFSCRISFLGSTSHEILVILLSPFFVLDRPRVLALLLICANVYLSEGAGHAYPPGLILWALI